MSSLSVTAVCAMLGGRIEPGSLCWLLSAGEAVAVINPRQLRDFAKATGVLAKTNAVDARVLAHFARAVRPAVRAMQAPEFQELEALITRRRQLIEMIGAERHRLASATQARVRKQIEAHLTWLEKQLSQTDDDMGQLIERSSVMQRRLSLLTSVPGVGRVTATVLTPSYPS